MKINLHIERIVLEGISIPSSQHQVLQTSMATSLIQMLADGGLSSRFVQDTSLRHISTTNSIQQDDANNLMHLGNKVAQSLYRGIGYD